MSTDFPLSLSFDATAWRPDILGPGFEALELPLTGDEEGDVVATLIRYHPHNDPGALPDTPTSPVAVMLYLHGWNDYFFQVELARHVARAGCAFYALDLRKYGRSLREGQTRGFITSLSTYDEDIGAALRVIRSTHTMAPLVLGGHSTGGLTATTWADRHPGAFAGLFLNSPWLEFQANALIRRLTTPVAESFAWANPLQIIPVSDNGFYHRVLTAWRSEDEQRNGIPEAEVDGPDDPFWTTGWQPDPRWRLNPSAPLRAGWISAILDGHARVAQGMAISAPTLVMTSADSSLLGRWSSRLRGVDTVLDVDVIRQRALSLGDVVTIIRLEGAIHDVTLSRRTVRERAFGELRRWLRTYVL